MLRQRPSFSSESWTMRCDSSSSSLPLSSSGGSYHLQSSPLSSASSTSTPISRKLLCLVALISLLPWGLYSRTASQWTALTFDMKKLQDSQKKAAFQLSTKKQLLSAFEANKKHLETTTESLVSDLRKKEILIDTHADNYEQLEAKEEAQLARIDELESHIQENSQFAITEDYGDGPYQVEITLSSKGRTKTPSLEPIVFELAPLNMMPHSVHFFLRMLTQELWLHMTFTPQMTARHRIHASPVDMDTLNRVDYKFKDAKLTSLAFGEQSPNSCGPYSVGFSGTPGGPDFYVNGAFVPKSFAKQSCFAKVISGEKLVDGILDGKYSGVLGIETIRLLPPEDMISP